LDSGTSLEGVFDDLHLLVYDESSSGVGCIQALHEQVELNCERGETGVTCVDRALHNRNAVDCIVRGGVGAIGHS